MLAEVAIDAEGEPKPLALGVAARGHGIAAIAQHNNFVDGTASGTGDIAADTQSSAISRHASGQSGSNYNPRFFSPICALSLGISFVMTILLGSVILPIAGFDESNMVLWASRCLLDASVTLHWQCIAHAGHAVFFILCVLVEHSTWLIGLVPAIGTHWQLRIGRDVTALQSSFRARHANDIALACTTMSSNIWLIASRNAESGSPFQFVALVLCGPTCVYAILRGIHSASALLAWTLSFASVAMKLWLVGDPVDAPTCVTAAVALGIIARIRSLEQECMLLRSHRSPMLAANFLAERESTALATKVAAATQMATELALAKSDAAAECALRASVALAESIAAETRTNTVRARQEADSLARQAADASAGAIVIAQAKSDSEIAVARRESESLTQELSTSKEGNARLEIALLRSEKQMLESNSSQLRALMGNVAHDLKTPLQAISMGIELLRLEHTSSVKHHSIANSRACPSSNSTGLLDNMEASCVFIKTAINRSIDFTKSSKNIALLPALETVDLEAVIREQMRMMCLLKQNVTIELADLPSGICMFAITDKHWLAENVLCLLSNAIKYSDGGLIQIRIQVMSLHDHDSVDPTCLSASACALRITISDTGIGISESARATLFQPFQQAQKMAGGTGLGLYSMLNRVTALGGRCGVAARDDGARGSAFWFDFPYRPDTGAMKAHSRSHQSLASMRLRSGSDSGSDADRDASSVESCTSKLRRLPIAALTSGSAAGVGGDMNVAAGSSGKPELDSIDVFLSPEHSLLELDRAWAVCRSQSGNAGGSDASKHALQPLKLRILLVDDAPFIITMTKRMLEKNGHTVESASNGSLGLAKLMKTHGTVADFDLVLCDFQMPVMDGFEAVRRYRAFERDAKALHAGAQPAQNPKCVHRADMAIVGMSANSDIASMTLAREVGMNAVIPKPFSIANLQRMLQLFHNE